MTWTEDMMPTITARSVIFFKKGISIMRMKCMLAATCAALLFHPGTAKAQLVQSTFDTGADGWFAVDINQQTQTVLGIFPVTWNATGGNPGGYISSTDPSSHTFYFAAPSQFLGDQSAALGGSIKFDLADEFSSGVPHGAVVLQGAGHILGYVAPSPGTGFTPYMIPLTPGGWTDLATMSTPTTAVFDATVGSLQAFLILGDWNAGADNTSLDNVSLNTSVPEPGSAAVLLGLGVSGAGLLLRRRVK